MNNYLQAPNGDFSSKRLMALICLGVAVILAACWVIWKVDTLKYAGMFLGAALALQGIAWGAENSISKKNDDKGG